MTATAPGALSGIRIVDFSRILAGPYATMLLSDFGAEVTRLERPNVGDDTRGWGPPWHEGESTYFLGLNRNKRSVAFDLTSEADRAMAHELIAEADVVVENFRPGTLERYGFGYEQLAADHKGMPHGGFVIRSGDTGAGNRQVIEYSLDLGSNPEFTASVLVAYARAVHRLSAAGQHGALTPFDVAPGLLSPRSAEELRAQML